MELIERAALKKVPMFNGKYDKEHANEHFIYGIESVMEYIEQMPTIDAVPVVRCRECKWFADNNGGEWFGCQMFNAIRAVPEDAPGKDDFCSYGERRAEHGT